MTKKEFLNGLWRALAGKMESEEVQKHVDYYQEYIEIQVRKGMTEEQVIEELGTPSLIAKSILTATGDSGAHLDDITFYSALTRLKSVFAGTGGKVSRQLKTWFDQLR